MKVICLGTGVMAPSDAIGQTACYLLPEEGILLDAGTGLYRLEQHMRSDCLDIYISHAHGDHTFGLFWLTTAILRNQMSKSNARLDLAFEAAGKYAKDLVSDRLRILGDPPTLTAMRENPYLSALIEDRNLRLVDLGPEEEVAGGGTVKHFPLEHTVTCSGFRFDWPGHSLAYVTDTTAGPGAPYIDQIRGVDLLLHERTLPDEAAEGARKHGHSWTTAVARLAAAAGVGRLVCIHNRPSDSAIDTARAIFSQTEEAFDGMEIEF